MKLRKTAALFMAAAMSVSLLAGCGGNSANSSNSGKTSSEAVGESSTGSGGSGTQTSEPSGNAGDPIQKDVVNVGVETDPSDLSPFGPQTTGRTAVINNMYESLGHMIDGEFVGVLAKSYELSEDEKTLTFYLYENIHDQAGNPFTASDVVFSFNTKVDAGNFANVDFVESVEAVDDYTVQFNLDPPLTSTNIATLVQETYCVTQAAYEASSDGMVTDGIVSTSHYKVADYQSGYLLTLEKYKDYWQTDAALIHERNQANADTINFYVMAESNQRTIALENGTIDMCWSIPSTDLYKFEEGGEQSANYWTSSQSDNLSTVLLFNHSDGHETSDVNLRKAIGYAINSEMIVQSVYGGYAEANYDISRSASAGFNEAWKTQDNFQQYDAEKSADYLAQSGYSGNALSLLCNSDSASTNAATLIQGFLAAVGINVEINSVDSATINTYLADDSQWDLALTQTAAEIYVTQSWLKHLDYNATGTGKTLSFLKDDTLEELVLNAAYISTSTQETIDACHDYVTENAIILGLANPHLSYVVNKDCQSLCFGYKHEILPGACVYTK